MNTNINTDNDNVTDVQTIEDLLTEEFYSPYKLAKAVNKILDNVGIEKVLPPQMFYTYVKKGYIKADDNKRITREDAITWTEKYIAKYAA